MIDVCAEKTAINALKILISSSHNSVASCTGIWDLPTPGVGDL